MARRVSRLWRRSPDGSERRLERLESQMRHLEAELEGLQDAVHRQAVLEDEQIDELRARTAPAQVARDLSDDARRRGL
jgi:uncharacterized coiled-coil protein SlyX